MMGKKKHKDRHGDKNERRHEAAGDAARAASFGLPLAGIAAMVTQQLQSPAARAAMATGLRAAADALSSGATHPSPPPPPVPPQPPVPPRADVPPQPEVPPTASATERQAPPQGTTRSPDPHDIGVVLSKAAEQLLGAFLQRKR